MSQWNAVHASMSLVKLEKVCQSSKRFMKALRFWVWRSSIVSTVELFLYVWKKEESEEIFEAELSENEIVDQEGEEVIICRKGLGRVLVREFIQVHQD